MGAVKIQNNGQSLTLTAVYDMDHEVSISAYSDAALQSALTLPHTLGANEVVYLRNGTCRVTVTVSGGSTYSERVNVQREQQIVDIPLESVATDAHAAGAVQRSGETGPVDLSGATVTLPVDVPGTIFADVKRYGAIGDGAADDTASITSAVNAVHTAGGGVVYFPAGTYLTGQLTHYANTELRGAGRAAAVIKLKPSSNTDLLVTEGFATYTGGSQNGPSGFGLRSITLDANRTNQTSLSRCWVVYGYNYTVNDAWFINGYGGGVYSEWGGSDNPMESYWDNVKIYNYGGINGCKGLDWNGPHDSIMSNIVIATLDSTVTATQATYGATPIDAGSGATATFPGAGVPFTFTTTSAAPTSAFPTGGGKFLVPSINSLDPWAIVTYTSAVTVSSVTTFSGCTSAIAANRTAQASQGIAAPTFGLAINRGSGGHGETGLCLSQAHIWGRNHFGVFVDTPAVLFASSSQAEGAFVANAVFGSGCVWNGGSVYGTNGQAGQVNEIGIQLGWHDRSAGHCVIDTHVHNIGSSSSNSAAGGAVSVVNSSGWNKVRIAGTTQMTSRYAKFYSGSPDHFDAYCQNNTALNLVVRPPGGVPQFLGGLALGNNSNAVPPLSNGRIWAGSGAPNISVSVAGDYYLRTDTPSTSNQRLYVATGANTWSGIL